MSNVLENLMHGLDLLLTVGAIVGITITAIVLLTITFIGVEMVAAAIQSRLEKDE